MDKQDHSVSEPVAGVEWEVWCCDGFDRECPPKCEARGRGLVGGFVELWARHLFESVRPDGDSGFYSLHLWAAQRRVDIPESREAAGRLREWVFGSKEQSWRGYVAEADSGLLTKIAAAHAALHQARGTCEPILAAAQHSRSRQEFEDRLDELTR